MGSRTPLLEQCRLKSEQDQLVSHFGELQNEPDDKGVTCPARELLHGESVLGPGAQSPARAACVLGTVTFRDAGLSKGL